MVSVFWQTWDWTWQPELSWIFGSYAASLAIRDSRKCRKIIQSQWYQDNFGDAFYIVSDQNVKSQFENNFGAMRMATGLTGSMMGEGGDYIVIDDPLKLTDAYSETKRESANINVTEGLFTRENDPDKVCKIMIMQRLHDYDPVGYVKQLEDEGGEEFEMLVLPQEFEPAFRCATSLPWQDPRTKKGELLWPSRFDDKWVKAKKKTLGTYGWSSQQQQRPTPLGGGYIKSEWFKYWQPKGANLPPVQVKTSDGSIRLVTPVDLPDEFDEMAQSWDCTFKDNKDNDFVVGGVWGKKGADAYLVDQVKALMDIVKTIDAIVQMSNAYPRATLKLIEEKANGAAVIRLLRGKVAGLVPINPKDSKESRVVAIVPTIEGGNVFIPHPQLYEWVRDYIAELTAFNKGANDDQVDQTSQILNRWYTQSTGTYTFDW